jgi:alginate O-acetyltransferase complex protein AlgJ
MNRKRDLALLLTFLIGLTVPTAVGIALPSWSVVPKTPQQPLPRHPWLRSFPKKFEKYFDTHLGGRRAMVAVHHMIDLFAFKVSPTDTVLSGKDGWAFLNQDFMPESILGGDFPENDLRQWVEFFKDTQREIAPWNGKLLVVVAPNKASIYPEKLPDISRENSGIPRLNAFHKRLTDEGISVLDLRDALRAAKNHDQLYAKRDTHWIGRGVLVASEQIAKAVERLSGQKVSFSQSQYQLVDQKHLGDLAIMMALEVAGEETVPTPIISKTVATQTSSSADTVAAGRFVFAKGAVSFKSEGLTGPSVLFHHDSFGEPLKLTLPNAFPRSSWIFWTGSVYKNIVVQHKPDVLVYLFAERYLHRAPPTIDTGRP